eukprot:956552_1
MAAPVDTNNEGESQMDQWLKQNRLTKVRDKFTKMEVIYEDLVELSSNSIDELKAYARDPLGLDLVDAGRFAKAVSGLKPKKKKERIVLTPEEADAIENIEQRQSETRARINKETNNINTLEDETNRAHKVVINAVKKRFDDIKDIDGETELCVYGYIRRCQSLLPSMDVYYNIPQLVYYIILSFHGACALDSSILTKPETSTLLSLLQESGKGLSDKRWSLLYRGS